MHCPLKGGTLRKTSNFVWAHTECHLLVHGSSPLSELQFSTDFSHNTKVFSEIHFYIIVNYIHFVQKPKFIYICFTVCGV